MASPVALALAIEERMRACPGIAGLDPDSRLVTVGPGHLVRGVRVPSEAEPGGGSIALELIGLADARLTEAAQGAREATAEVVAAAGAPAAAVEVLVTDVAPEVLPAQPTALPGLEGLSGPAPPTPRPAAASEATRADPERVREPPWPAPAVEPEGGTTQTVRVALEGPGEARTVLVITIQVAVERQ